MKGLDMKQAIFGLLLLCATYMLAEVLTTDNKHNYNHSSSTVISMFGKPTSDFNLWSYTTR